MELSVRVATVIGQATNSLQMQVKRLFKEIGEDCPFLLAKHLEIKINYIDLGSADGYYTETVPGYHHIFINQNSDIETQEEVCFKLTLHHLEQPGVKKLV